jgi:hypothetical protein
MKGERTDLDSSTPSARVRATSRMDPLTEADPWAGEDSACDENRLAHRRTEGPSPVNSDVVCALWVWLLCAALGAIIWGLAGYGLYRLLAEL